MSFLQDLLRNLGFIDEPAPQKQMRQVPRQAAQQTPAQRDFPGRTNYGVPEDNMIDSPQGYITRQQYNEQQMQKPNPIMGSQPVSRGIYSPGEGLRTNFNRFR